MNESETAEGGDTGATMTPRQVFILKIAIGIMSFLLVVGFILLLVGIYYQSVKSVTPAELAKVGLQRRMDAPPPFVNLPMKPGTQLINVLVDQGRLILHLQDANTHELVVVDLASGWQQQRIILAPQQ